MAKTPCGFCESVTEKIINEHFFGKWMEPLLGTGKPGVIVRNTFKLDHTAVRPSHAYGLDRRVRMACKSCNNVGTSDLENTVRPLIAPMILGHARVPLTLKDQLVVARWAVKTAMVAEYLQKTHTRYFTQGERRFEPSARNLSNEIAGNNPSDNVMTFQFSRCIILPPLGLL